MTGYRDICDASGGNKNRTSPFYGKWHMQYQGCNIAYAHSETPRRPFKIVNPVSHIISQISIMPHRYHLWQLAHAASVILDASSALAYTVSKIIKKTLEDTGTCPTSS